VIRVAVADDQALVRAGSQSCCAQPRTSRWSVRQQTDARRSTSWPGSGRT
jgi:hypothetical protein